MLHWNLSGIMKPSWNIVKSDIFFQIHKNIFAPRIKPYLMLVPTGYLFLTFYPKLHWAEKQQ